MVDTAPARTIPEPTSPPPRPRRGGSAGVGLAVLLSLVALGGSAYLFYRFQQDAGDRSAELVSLRNDHRQLSTEVARLERELASGTAAQHELDRKLSDAAETNRSVREELLGLGERARLVEDAVSNLAEKSLGGATALKLNEAEFLLRMGTERLRLFDDIDGTLDAFRLADVQLADVDDPVLSGVRQTLAAEIESLAAAPRTDWNGAIAKLDALADASPAWPMRATPLLTRNDDPDATVSEKLGDILSRFVRIRRVDEAGASFINPLNADAARAATLMEIELAKAALAARDSTRAGASLERARQRVNGAFDPANPAVRDALAMLETLRESLTPVATPETGKALEALANLRATQALRATPSTPVIEPATPSPPSEPANASPDAPSADRSEAPATDAPEAAPPANPDGPGERLDTRA